MGGRGGESTGRGRLGQIRDGELAPNPCPQSSGVVAEVAPQWVPKAGVAALRGAAGVPAGCPLPAQSPCGAARPGHSQNWREVGAAVGGGGGQAPELPAHLGTAVLPGPALRGGCGLGSTCLPWHCPGPGPTQVSQQQTLPAPTFPPACSQAARGGISRPVAACTRAPLSQPKAGLTHAGYAAALAELCSRPTKTDGRASGL